MKRNKKVDSIHTNIDGMDITISTHNIHIEDSYRVIYPPDMKIILNDTIEFLNNNHISMDTPFNHRSTCSMVQEWVAHNNAYKLNFRPEQSRSVDLDWPQPWYTPILYFVCSIIVL